MDFRKGFTYKVADALAGKFAFRERPYGQESEGGKETGQIRQGSREVTPWRRIFRLCLIQRNNPNTQKGLASPRRSPFCNLGKNS